MNLFISSAEPSGDIIAAEILAALKTRFQEHPFFMKGLGGSFCEKQGLTSLFPISDITVHGFVEVLPKVWQILKRIRQTADSIIDQNPDLVITVDAFDFHIRVARILRKRGFSGKLVHVVAPAVWAWGGGRAKKLMQGYDALYCVLPFEPKFFQKEGFKAFYVGNPVLHRFMNHSPLPDHFRAKYGIHEKAFVLTILPGSRESEVKRLLGDFLKSASLLHEAIPNIHITIPTFPSFQSFIQTQIKSFSFPISLVDQEDKIECFNKTNFALAASGTIALELSLFKFPFLIAYKVSPLTAFIAHRIAKVNSICLINILMNETIIPEFVQEECTAQNIFEAAFSLIKDKDKTKKFEEGKQKALSLLQTNESMADCITQYILQEMNLPLGF